MKKLVFFSLIVSYNKTGLPIIESVNTFGAFIHQFSPHFKDQMKMFQDQKTKPITIDKAAILRTAEKINHPVL